MPLVRTLGESDRAGGNDEQNEQGQPDEHEAAIAKLVEPWTFSAHRGPKIYR